MTAHEYTDMISSTISTALANGPDCAISAGTVARPPPLHCNNQMRCIAGFTFLVKSDPVPSGPGSSRYRLSQSHWERFALHASTAFARGSSDSGPGFGRSRRQYSAKTLAPPSPRHARLATLRPQLRRGRVLTGGRRLADRAHVIHRSLASRG